MTDKEQKTTFDYQFIELDLVDSTNSYALEEIHAGRAKDGQVYLARQQFAGKGQRGKKWISEPDQNIIMSLVVDVYSLSLPLSGQFLLGAATGLGCLYAAQAIALESWRLKWPNDLYWQDRKAAGILIENIVRGTEWRYAVIGVGMNLNQISFPAGLSTAVSLKQITGKSFVPRDFAEQLVMQIGRQIQCLRSDPSGVLKSYNESLYNLGEIVNLKKENESFKTKIIGVNAEGKLLTEKGPFAHGEVEFVFITS